MGVYPFGQSEGKTGHSDYLNWTQHCPELDSMICEKGHNKLPKRAS